MEFKLTKNIILIAFACLLLMVVGSGLYFHSKVTELEAKLNFNSKQMTREIQTVQLALPSAPKPSKMIKTIDINPYSSEVTMPSDIPAPIMEKVMPSKSMDEQMDFHKEMMAEMMTTIPEENNVHEINLQTDDVEDTISEPEPIKMEEEVEEVEVESDDESDEDSEIVIDDLEDEGEADEDFKGLLSDDEESEEMEDLPTDWNDLEEEALKILDGKLN